jgi:uncharacterized protein (TIGR03545 family)
MRWKAVIPIAVILAGIFVFFAFFGNTVARNIIEKAGSGIVGAKVEVDGLKLSPAGLSIEVRGLQVGSPSDEWKNIFEAKKLKFALNPRALFSKKFVIDEMTAAGISLSTKRRTSGKLPAKPAEEGESAFAAYGKKLLAREFEKLPIADLDSFKQNLDISKLLNINDLNSIKDINALKAQVDAKGAYWDETVKNLKATDDLNAVAERIKAVNLDELKQVKDAAGLEKIKQKAQEIKAIKDSIEAMKNDLAAKQSRLGGDFSGFSAELKKVDEEKKKDYKALSEKVKFRGIDRESIARTLFGQVWVERADKWLYWLDRIWKFMPIKSTLKPPKRSKGVNITFPREHSYPGFLLRKVFISVEKDGGAASGGYFEGSVEGVTSDPHLYGKPMLLDIRRDNPLLALKGVVDHTTEDGKDALNLRLGGLDMTGFVIGKNPVLPEKLSGGSADISVSLSVEKEVLDINLKAELTKVRFDLEGGGVSSLAKEFAGVISGAGSITLEARMHGRKDDLKVEVRSNLDSLLSEKANALVRARLKETEDKLKEEADKAIKAEQDKVTGIIEGRKKELMDAAGAKQQELQQKLDMAKAKADEIEKLINDRVGQEKQKLEAEKKRQEAELKKKAEQELKNKLKGIVR